MTYNKVSDENLAKVQGFFVQSVKETGSNRIEATVQDIAEGSDVALATAHKAIKQLVREEVITMIKPKSRRYPITYVYNENIENFEVSQDKDAQIEYLQNKVREQQEEIESLSRRLREAEGTIRVLENNSNNMAYTR